MNKKFYVEVSGVSSSILSMFFADSVSKMLPWLAVMVALVACDLIAGVCKAWKIGEKVSAGRAIRDTLAKSCTYFSAIVFACLFQVAAGGDFDCCGYVAKGLCTLEGVSIVRNIFRWHGLYIDKRALVTIIVHRIFGGDKEDYKDIIVRDDGNKENH